MRPHELHDCAIDGDTIRSVREFWAFTRRDFASIFGVTLGTVFVWERDGITCRNQKFSQQTFYILKILYDLPRGNGETQ